PDPYGLGHIPPIPTWVPPVDPDSPYPLLLCGAKSRARTHSIHGNQPRLARVDRDDVWMNPADAAQRGIADGDLVRIFNGRGETRLKVRVTDRVLAGVGAVKEGGWRLPVAEGCVRQAARDLRRAPEPDQGDGALPADPEGRRPDGPGDRAVGAAAQGAGAADLHPGRHDQRLSVLNGHQFRACRG